ncbi:cysteine dioxygenase family protein [Bacillus piscicola]|uniref:cysteine dioxygenase family protein n=1 Tax=Bacillus piscicola TaxID=1632684 RepID=UPI001F09BBCF|nr:cysteine dioxygenase family protein [Bacillus piscicola]
MITAENYPGLATLIKEVNEIIKEYEEEKSITEQVSNRLAAFIKKYPHEIPVSYKRANPDKYVLYPLFVSDTDNFSISVAVWDVGQSTPIHDHGVWGVIGIVEGSEREIQYQKHTHRLEQTGEYHLGSGDVKVCCSSDQDIHEVSCASDIPCVAVHIYGGNVGELTRYVYEEENGEKKAVITPWDSRPLIS